MRIGVDIDGVIADTFPLLVQELNAYFAVRFELKHVYDYDIYNVYGITPEEVDQFNRDKGNILIEDPLPLEGAIYYLNLLSKEHIISLVSARSDRYYKQTEKWLQQYSISYDHLLLLGQHDKREICTRLAVDLFIEDSLKNALQLSGCGIPVILLDAPYNQGCLPEGVVRRYNWEEIYRTVQDLKGKIAGKGGRKMEIFHKIGETAKGLGGRAREVTKRSGELLEATKLKFELSRLDREMENNLCSLGELVYRRSKGEEGLDGEIERLCTSTRTLEADMQSIQD